LVSKAIKRTESPYHKIHLTFKDKSYTAFGVKLKDEVAKDIVLTINKFLEKYIKENKIKRLTLTEKENLSEKYNYPLDERYNYILNKILDEEKLFISEKDNKFVINGDSEAIKDLEISKNMNFEEREEIIRQKRVIALKEILQEKGFSGILELSLKGDCASTIGFLLRRFVFSSDEESVQLIKLALESFKKDAHINYKNIIRGLLSESNDNISLFESLSVCLDDSDKV